VGADRTAKWQAGTLWDPPNAADPVMSAYVIFFDVVQTTGPTWNRRIQRSIPSERFNSGVRLGATVVMARRVVQGVERGGDVFATKIRSTLLFATLLGEQLFNGGRSWAWRVARRAFSVGPRSGRARERSPARRLRKWRRPELIYLKSPASGKSNP